MTEDQLARGISGLEVDMVRLVRISVDMRDHKQRHYCERLEQSGYGLHAGGGECDCSRWLCVSWTEKKKKRLEEDQPRSGREVCQVDRLRGLKEEHV